MDAPSELQSRLNAVFDEAQSRISEFQQKAGRETIALKERYAKFEEIRTRLRETIFLPRLKVLQERFPDGKMTPMRSRDIGAVVFSIGRTVDVPASVEVHFHFRHDGRVENVILEYELHIRPAFTDFERSARFETPLLEVNDAAIAQWMDDRIVQFSQTYLSLRFVNEYQKEVLVTDPVAQVRFPKGFAKATREHGGETLYFASEESVELFDQNPPAYLADGAPVGAGAAQA